MNLIKRNWLSFAALIGAVVLSGCATRTPMAYGEGTSPLEHQTKPVYLMAVTLKNNYRKTWQPEMLVVHVEKPGAKESSERLNFTIDEPGKDETGSDVTGNRYFLRMGLDAGQYDLVGVTSLNRSFPIIGTFFTPLHSNVEAKSPGVYYLGHVRATVRERQGNEFKAGPSIPLVDQAVVGASGGTFDVEILDELAEDEPAFRKRFPALEGVPIVKALLPPFDREKAQKWWEAH